jgi:hypothetical protein
LRNKLEAGIKDGAIVLHDRFMEFRDHRLTMELNRLRDGARQAINEVLRAAGIHDLP